jgi:DNA-binding NarL/FixJ family response regulator
LARGDGCKTPDGSTGGPGWASATRPRAALALLLTVVLAMVPGLFRLRLNTDGAALVPPDDPAVAADRAARRLFGLRDPLLVILETRHPDGIWNAGTLDRLGRLTRDLAALPGIGADAVQSLATERSDRFDPGTSSFRTLLDPPPRTTRRLRTIVPQTRILVLSIHTDPCYVQAAFAAGAHAYLPKTVAAEEIESALREVHQGRFYVSPVVAQAALVAVPPTPTARREVEKAAGQPLTAREIAIVRLVGKGLGNKAIAQELGVSVTTVRTHLSRVYEKLTPGSRVELALYAAQTGEPVM